MIDRRTTGRRSVCDAARLAEQFAERVLADEREQAHLHAVEHPAEQGGDEGEGAAAGRDGGDGHDGPIEARLHSAGRVLYSRACLRFPTDSPGSPCSNAWCSRRSIIATVLTGCVNPHAHRQPAETATRHYAEHL